MTKTRFLIGGAWLVYIAAWFLPVVKEGVTFPQGVPGWQAFRVAACAVWPYEGFSIDGWYNVVLSTVSAITTLFFVIGSVWATLTRLPAMRRAFAWAAALGFIINAHWVVRFGSNRLDLRIGYFLWWFSFIFLALGLFQLSHSSDNS